jgi:hypothetical protein
MTYIDYQKKFQKIIKIIEQTGPWPRSQNDTIWSNCHEGIKLINKEHEIESSYS